MLLISNALSILSRHNVLHAVFIDLESRRICLAGVTRHPDQEWMEQMARNVMMEDSGFLINRRYLLHDRDSKYCSSFRQLIEAIFFRFK